MKAWVVDTNVLVVAEGKTPQAGPDCLKNCARSLRSIQEEGLIAIDREEIIAEYFKALSGKGEPRLGMKFLFWLVDHRANPDKCEQVEIHPAKTDSSNYEEFPKDPDLARFDPSDRKFVAVALTSKNNPAILNATDRDWWEFRSLLEKHGLRIEFLCPENVADRAKHIGK